jgi:pyruvate,water dikinase
VLGPTLSLPTAALPGPMQRMTRALLLIRDLGTTALEGRRPLQGVGIGTTSAIGRACVAVDPNEALARFEPGDILVALGTTPAFNALLAVASAVVTEEGGHLSHAAVMARELGIPAVIGAAGALADIADGSMIEVDPVAGRVRVATVTAT